MVVTGVTVGDGTVIAGGAVVVKDVEPFSIVAGVPARVIGYRFPEHIRKGMLELAWWNWPKETIRLAAPLLNEHIDDEVLEKLQQFV